MEMAAETWKGRRTGGRYGGGGTVWNSIVYDPDFNSVYIGVGNGSPWTREVRSPGGGDNLFLSSVVALDADTGEYKWHYQTTPGDNWDYTAVQDIALADMTSTARIARCSCRRRRTASSTCSTEPTGSCCARTRSPTVDVGDARRHGDGPTGGESRGRLRRDGRSGSCPARLGAHNWQAMSIDPENAIAYLPVQENALIYAMSDEYYETGLYKRHPGRMNLGLEFGRIAQLFVDNVDDQPTVKGYLKAFNFLTGEEKWAVEFPHYWNGGVLATEGGVVFHGNALGMFVAYDQETGDVLWEYNTHVSMLAPPISYEIDGVQYVSIMTGTGGGDLFSGEPLDPVAKPASLVHSNTGRMLVFKLGGEQSLPTPTVRDTTIPKQQLAEVSDEVLAQGEVLYHDFCALCHGLIVRSGGVISDLRRMGEGSHTAFEDIVLGGIMKSVGMASFEDALNSDQVTLIHNYVKARAHEDREAALGNGNAKLTWLK